MSQERFTGSRSFPLPGSMTTRQFINGFVHFAGDSFHSSLRGPACRMVRRSERLHCLREATGECRVMRVWHCGYRILKKRRGNNVYKGNKRSKKGTSPNYKDYGNVPFLVLQVNEKFYNWMFLKRSPRLVPMSSLFGISTLTSSSSWMASSRAFMLRLILPSLTPMTLT